MIGTITGKAKGMFPKWYNIQTGDNEPKNVDRVEYRNIVNNEPQQIVNNVPQNCDNHVNVESIDEEINDINIAETIVNNMYSLNNDYCDNDNNNAMIAGSQSVYNHVFNVNVCDDVSKKGACCESIISQVKPLVNYYVPKNEHDEVYVTQDDNENVILAKQAEIEKLKGYEAYEEVDNHGQQVIGSRWVITNKPNGSVKARLVAKGFQEEEEIQADSPTVGRSTLRLFLAIVQIFNWNFFCLDIKSAFLQGDKIDRELYIQPPKGFSSPDKLWKLNKCLYGLKDGSRKFYLNMRKFLVGCGCVVSDIEPTLYLYFKDQKLSGILLSHVDDFLGAGTELFHKNVVTPLKKQYQVSKLEENKSIFTGISLEKLSDHIAMSMGHFIEGLCGEKFSVPAGSRDLDSREYTMYRSLVGKMNWLAGASRPDLAFKTVDFSTKFQCACLKDLRQVNKAVENISTSDYSVCFPALDINTLSLAVFTDASLGNLSNCGSCGGYVIFLVDRNMNACPISWHCGRLKRVATSTLAAETLALIQGLDDSVYINELIRLCLGRRLNIIGLVDNRGLV